MSKPGEQTGKPECIWCGMKPFRHFGFEMFCEEARVGHTYTAVPSAAPVVTELDTEQGMSSEELSDAFMAFFTAASPERDLPRAEDRRSTERHYPIPDAVVSHRSELNWKHGIRNFTLSGEGKDAECLDEIAAEAYQKFAVVSQPEPDSWQVGFRNLADITGEAFCELAAIVDFAMEPHLHDWTGLIAKVREAVSQPEGTTLVDLLREERERCAMVICGTCRIGDIPKFDGKDWLHTGLPGEVEAHRKNYICKAGRIHAINATESAPPSLPKAAISYDPALCEVHGVTMESCRLDKREECRALPKAGEKWFKTNPCAREEHEKCHSPIGCGCSCHICCKRCGEKLTVSTQALHTCERSAAPPLLPVQDNLNTFAVGNDSPGPQPTTDKGDGDHGRQV